MFKVELFIDNLLQPDGRLSQIDAPDFLHPSEIGYRKIFEPIFEHLTTILNNWIKEDFWGEGVYFPLKK